jgi:polysaccharide biosynthesis/export protein
MKNRFRMALLLRTGRTLFLGCCLGVLCSFSPSPSSAAQAGGTNLVASVLNSIGAPSTNAVGPNLPADLSGYVPDDKYKLRIGDKISLQIIEDRDPAKTLMVADSGEVDVPYIGRVAAVDKTCKELAAELKQNLEKEYYYRATVVTALDTANKLLGRVYVWGQVKNQGAVDLLVNQPLTAAQAILRAGGFGDFAKKDKVKVVRGGGPGSKGQEFFLDMTKILEQGKTDQDVVLQPEDSIIVPKRLFNL